MRSESRSGSTAEEGLWFAELLERDVLGPNATWGANRIRSTKQEWLRAWEYSEEERDGGVAPFRTDIPGLLGWPHVAGMIQFITKAQPYAEGTLIPVDALYAAAHVGLLALDLVTTTGMGITEAMQLRLAHDCLTRLEMPVYSDAADHSPVVRYAARVLLDTEQPDLWANYFVGKETLRLIWRVAKMLNAHYGLKDEELIPAVAFDTTSSSNIPLDAAPYLFQYSNHHLPDHAICACVRFLLHGMGFTDRNGNRIELNGRLIQRILETPTLQDTPSQEDIIEAWLNQKDSGIASDRGGVACSIVDDPVDRYFAQFASCIDVHEAIRQSSEEWQSIYSVCHND